mmetsp:Transcript_3340/g.4762  ORF Transcript_3340/g.4762 Transcript_3340/m.4762 type:complete len:903 (+) Transcript_3340:426-3134(+)
MWTLSKVSDKMRIFELLLRTDHTATFLNKRFPNAKVFGIEGCESLIPGLWGILEEVSKLGCEGIEMGMAHRGRMNVLHNFFQKPLSSICNNFHESEPSELGDVKYHLGTRVQLTVRGEDEKDRIVHISLAANPSHLEAVNPVVIGKCKAKQFFIGDATMKKVCPLLLHGDASFSGQGIVPETLELSDLPDYTVGGSIHIVINNQIGFTTDPRSARTSYHCTNSAKGVGAPIFHVNGDDVEAVVVVCKLAAAFRQQFGKDVVVDIVCYRRHGHNSQDDPSITQPLTYSLIQSHPTTLQIYFEKLKSSGVLSDDDFRQISSKVWTEFEADFKDSLNYKPNPLEWLASNWQGAAIGSLISTRPYNQTGVRLATLSTVGNALTYIPPHIEVHKDIMKLIKSRQKALDSGEGFTMAFAEALAFGCLMTKYSPDLQAGLRGLTADQRTLENANNVEFNTLDVQLQEHPSVHIRLSGQDVIRGTFNQRHAAIYCQKSISPPYWQLNNLNVKEQASISVCNSSLSEAAVLAFEYGYSLSNEMALTIWEAQFGDFANNAQTVIDNFIAAGEHKWNNHSSLVLLLPHGYDGQGPEHSSGRIERFLQLVDDDEDSIPGKSSYSKAEMQAGFAALDFSKDGVITKEDLARALARFTDVPSERIDLRLAELMTELSSCGDSSGNITKEAWFKLLESWCLQNSERQTNLIVVMPSTPAQYFHCLRRQIHRSYSKPLVCFSGKWLLHHKACVSSVEDMTVGTFFQRVILEGSRGDNMRKRKTVGLVSDADMKRVIICSGKVFYHLYHAREAAGVVDVTLIRLEQIAPFPHDLLGPAILRYPAADIVWCQEEPKNMGAWSFIKPRLMTTLRENGVVKTIEYVGRKPSSSPANGGYKLHVAEQKELIDRALMLEREKNL